MGVASTGTGWLGLLTKCQLCVWSHGSSKYWHWLAWSPYQMSVVCVVTWEWQELALVGLVSLPNVSCVCGHVGVASTGTGWLGLLTKC